MKISDIINNGFLNYEEWIQGRYNLNTFSWNNESQKKQVFQRIKEKLNFNKGNQEFEIRNNNTWKVVCKINLNELLFE